MDLGKSLEMTVHLRWIVLKKERKRNVISSSKQKISQGDGNIGKTYVMMRVTTNQYQCYQAHPQSFKLKASLEANV